MIFCKKCQTEKPTEEFYSYCKSKCKSCCIKHASARRKRYPESSRVSARKYYQSNRPEILKKAYARAKKKSVKLAMEKINKHRKENGLGEF